MKQVPIGYYILGTQLRGEEVKRWSTQAFTTLPPGGLIHYNETICHPTKIHNAHVWGFARLCSITIGMNRYNPTNGALFIDIDQQVEPGILIRIEIEVLDVSY
jgi:hypothetical protein